MKFTSKDSLLKSISSKPLKITTRDSIIVTAITVVATILMLWIYYVAMKTPDQDREYRAAIIQTTISSLLAQYLYEYTGLNNMLAESSLRYANKDVLGKYKSRREAVLYKCMYQLKIGGVDVGDNFTKLKIILTQPKLTGLISSMASRKKLLNFATEDVEALLQLPVENRAALEVISERVTENMTYDILVNGFADYKLTDGRAGVKLLGEVFPVLRDVEKLEERGAEIAKKYN